MRKCRPDLLAFALRRSLAFTVDVKAQLMSYPIAKPSLKISMRWSTITNPYLALQSAEDEQVVVQSLVKDNSQFPTLDHVAYEEDESMVTGQPFQSGYSL